MTTWLDRLSDNFGRWLDGAVLQERAIPSPGYSLATVDYQLNKARWPDANIGEYRKAYASQVAVYAAIMERARAVSSAPVRVYREEEGDQVEQPDHPLRLLLSQPNPMMSESEFLLLTQVLMDATGFCAIQKARNSSGVVVQLWHLRSDWLKEIKRRQQPSDWEYRVPGREPVTLPAADVLIIAGGPATDLSVTGLSPIAVALREVGIDAALTDFLKLFIDQGGMPVHALVTPNTIRDQAAADLHRALWQQAFGGFRNWGKTPILSDGMDVKQIGSDLDALAYPELRALTETHICTVFGVPPILLGIQAGLDAATYSNYAQARKAFYEGTVSGLWARLDGALTRGLLRDEYGDDRTLGLEFDVSGVPALQEDKQLVWQRAGEMLARGGLTLNQAQMMLGLPGFGDAGDVLYLPISVQPTRPDDLVTLADQTAQPPQPVPAALQAGSGNGAEDENTGATSDDQGESDSDTTRDRQRAREARIFTLPLDTRARIATTNRRGQARIAAKYTPRLRTLFRRQGEVVATAYAKRADAEHETRDAAEIPWNELDAEMERELRALYGAAGAAAADAASSAVGVAIDWDLSNPLIRQVMNRLATRVVGINAQTRKDVARIVTEGEGEGLSTPQIAERLRGLYAETYRNRSLTIARTESQVSYNMATAAAYRESGVVLAMQCHDNELHTEPYGAADGLSCAERNGVISDVDAIELHIFAEHPNGTLAVSPLLVRPLGED